MADDGLTERRGMQAQVERISRAWFPSFRRHRSFRVFTFFLEYNRYLNHGVNSWRRVFDDKLLFSAFLAGIGVKTPATRWIVLNNNAFSPTGERIPTRELVEQLLTGHWFVKPHMGKGGHGAFLLQDGVTTSADGHPTQMDSTALLELLGHGGGFLVQDVVVQSAEFAAFAFSSLNTVRCLTFVSGAGPAEVVAATLRMGTGHSVVDNTASGGFYCAIDLETRRLIGPGRDKHGNLFDQHPASGIALRDTPVERLNEIFDVCKLAHEVLGGPMTIGWDVAMTDEGPCIIEGNTMWSASGPKADPLVRQRLQACFLRECNIRGTGFPDDLPKIGARDFATVVFRAKGTVQDVGYRRWIRDLARAKNLKQAARNLSNGDVEVMLSGPLRMLEFAVMSATRGPVGSQVSEIEVLSLTPLMEADSTAISTASEIRSSRGVVTGAALANLDVQAKTGQRVAVEPRPTLDRSSESCGPRLTREDVDVGIDLGGGYLLTSQRPDGDFVYEVDWTNGAESPDDNAVRQAGATWGVALLYRETQDLAYRAALDRSLARWNADARSADGRRWQGQHGAHSGQLGAVALIGLSLLERLAAPGGLADPATVHASLDAICRFVEDARLPDGGFRKAFDPVTGKHSGSADPYSSGEALLLLARSGLELGVADRVARALGWAEEDYRMFVADPLAAEPDPDVTKGYYQWSSMSWFALANAGHGPDTWGRRLVEQALWMVDVHHTLNRTRNTGYAYEGIIPAWEWARRTGDEDTARKLACVVHQGLRKLCSWQLGHPLASAALRSAPMRFHGAVQNHAKQPALRIDVTQHQVHALMYARRFGIDAAEHLCDGDLNSVSMTLNEREEPNLYPESEMTSLFAINGRVANEFRALGFDVESTGPRMLLVTRDQKRCALKETETSFTSVTAYRTLKDKELSRMLFQRAGVRVPAGFVFGKEEKALAQEKLKELGTAVIKPARGNKGEGVSVNVAPESFEPAWSAASAATLHKILVEKFFANGDEARYLVVGGRCVAVLLRVPPTVYGDGSSTIRQLIERQNEIRRSNPSLRRRPISVDQHRRAILRSQGYSLDSVPVAGDKVVIDWKGGLSTGASSRNITSEAHVTMKHLAERVVASVPGLDIAGVDIVAHDHMAKATEDNYVVLEANTRPGIAGHHYPAFGQPINVSRIIAENCARNLGFDVDALRKNHQEMNRAVGLAGSGEPTPTDSELRRRLAADPVDGGAVPSRTGGYAQRMTVAEIPAMPGKEETRLVSVVFLGDTSMGDYYLARPSLSDPFHRLEQSPWSFVELLAPLVQDNSLLVANLETVLAERPADPFRGQKGYQGWDQPERTLSILQRLGVDAVSLANNHTMDYGSAPLLATIAHLETAGIIAFGAGHHEAAARQPLSLPGPCGNLHIFAGFEFRRGYAGKWDFYASGDAPGVNPLSNGTTSVADAVAGTRSSDPGSVIIVYPHWSGATNYQWANEEMTSLSQQLHSAGADLVIGHGAHRMQEIISGPEGTTVYSLGNFVFNSPGRYGVYNAPPFSLVARLDLEAQGSGMTGCLRLYPFVSDNRQTGFRPRPVREGEAVYVYDLLAWRGGGRFRDDFALEQDERGWCLTQMTPLSPRLAAPLGRPAQ